MGLLNNLTGWHALIILAIVVLLFGATKLPALAKSVGQSMNIFKSEMREEKTGTAGTVDDAEFAPSRAAASSTDPEPRATPQAAPVSERL
jgi:sec-independent protein translocase protein TatA